MKEIVYIFSLTPDESITIQLEEIYHVGDIFYNSFAYVFFNQNGMKTLLTYDTLNEECVLLSVFCKKVLEGKYYVDEQYSSDIGLVYNDAIYKSVRSNYKNKSLADTLECVDKLVVWSPIVSRNNMQTWLYNDANGQIILFIAPIYPFTFSSKRVKGYMPYEEWIKTYKPFVKRIIPPDVAYKWIQQAEEVMVLMEKNSRPYLE